MKGNISTIKKFALFLVSSYEFSIHIISEFMSICNLSCDSTVYLISVPMFTFICCGVTCCICLIMVLYSIVIERKLIIQFHTQIHTHYIHSVVVQDFVSGRASCVNQYHYESRYKHTMYVISLSNISIKTNFKQITRVEIRLTNLYNTLRRLHFVHDVTFICCRSFYCFINVAHIDFFYPAFQWYDVMTK